MEKSNNSSNEFPAELNNKKMNSTGYIRFWMLLMMMYALLFASIGYIAFWEQDFNNPDKFLVKYETLRQKHFEVMKTAYGDVDLVKEDEDFNLLINEYMKAANNSAGDLQELATQSFNIVLGALLAFLSASVTMVFQSNVKQNK